MLETFCIVYSRWTHSFVKGGFIVAPFFKRAARRNTLMNIDPTHTTNSSRQQVPKPIPSLIVKSLDEGSWFVIVVDSVGISVLVAIQLELIRSSGVFFIMCALTQHVYSVPGSNPLIWIWMVLALTLGTFTSWICPSDSADVVHDKSYPLMIVSLGLDHIIITEVESTWIEMFCVD